MNPMLNIAIQAARKAGDFIFKNQNFSIMKEEKILIFNKAQELITRFIHKFYPKHLIITENMLNLLSEKNDIRWIINPIDGVTNFLHNFPHFAVTVAIQIKEKTEFSVIYNPILNELFIAIRGYGVRLNNYRLRIKKNNLLQSIMIAVNFPNNKGKNFQKFHKIIKKLNKKYFNFRYTGSFALDFVYIASGRIDALCFINLNLSNFITGLLFIRESGGIITDLIGGENYIKSRNIIAGHPSIIRKILLEIKNIC
ncbi:MAG: inositol monophosphatase family protein [Arsenophonus sp.]|nr:MAG: inositol monophosphatase family protein [Arsenophonus sp.]